MPAGAYDPPVIDVPAGQLYLGEAIDGDHERTGEPVLARGRRPHDPRRDRRHDRARARPASASSCSRRRCSQGVPTLILDPKGDLGNLLLTFPDLAPESFAPWVERRRPGGGGDRRGRRAWPAGASTARSIQALRDARPVHDLHAGLDQRRAAQRRRAACSGRPDGTDAETIADEMRGLRVGPARPGRHRGRPAVEPRAHPARQPRRSTPGPAGQDLDLAGARRRRSRRRRCASSACSTSTTFFPPDDRTKLALRLNGLLASPAFAAWGQGEPLDIDALLGTRAAGPAAPSSRSPTSPTRSASSSSPSCSSKLVTWMRRQPGTDQLRALVYFDEVVGFVPPTAAPPAKKPILTLLKQARAFGVGARAGHAEPGRRRLQGAVQRRHVDDRPPADRAGQGPPARRAGVGGRRRRHRRRRRHDRGAGQARVRAPPGGQGRGRPPSPAAGRCRTSAARSPASRSPPSWPTAAPHPRRRRAATAAAPSDAVPRPHRKRRRARSDDATPVMPAVADGISVRWLDAAAPWAGQVGAVPTSTRYAAAVVATVDLLFDDTKADLRHTEHVRVRAVPARRPARRRGHDRRRLRRAATSSSRRAGRRHLRAAGRRREDQGASSPSCRRGSSTTSSPSAPSPCSPTPRSEALQPPGGDPSGVRGPVRGRGRRRRRRRRRRRWRRSTRRASSGRGRRWPRRRTASRRRRPPRRRRRPTS